MKKINIFDSNTYPTELEIIRKKQYYYLKITLNF